MSEEANELLCLQPKENHWLEGYCKSARFSVDCGLHDLFVYMTLTVGVRTGGGGGGGGVVDGSLGGSSWRLLDITGCRTAHGKHDVTAIRLTVEVRMVR